MTRLHNINFFNNTLNIFNIPNNLQLHFLVVQDNGT